MVTKRDEEIIARSKDVFLQKRLFTPSLGESTWLACFLMAKNSCFFAIFFLSAFISSFRLVSSRDFFSWRLPWLPSCKEEQEITWPSGKAPERKSSTERERESHHSFVFWPRGHAFRDGQAWLIAWATDPVFLFYYLYFS